MNSSISQVDRVALLKRCILVVTVSLLSAQPRAELAAVERSCAALLMFKLDYPGVPSSITRNGAGDIVIWQFEVIAEQQYLFHKFGAT